MCRGRGVGGQGCASKGGDSPSGCRSVPFELLPTASTDPATAFPTARNRFCSSGNHPAASLPRKAHPWGGTRYAWRVDRLCDVHWAVKDGLRGKQTRALRPRTVPAAKHAPRVRLKAGRHPLCRDAGHARVLQPRVEGGGWRVMVVVVRPPSTAIPPPVHPSIATQPLDRCLRSQMTPQSTWAVSDGPSFIAASACTPPSPT